MKRRSILMKIIIDCKDIVSIDFDMDGRERASYAEVIGFLDYAKTLVERKWTEDIFHLIEQEKNQTSPVSDDHADNH